MEFTQRRKEQNTTPVAFILLTDECIIFLKYFHQRPAKCIIAEQHQSLWLSLPQPSWRAELSSLRRGRSTQPLHSTKQHPWPCPLLSARVDGSCCDRGMGQGAPVTPGSPQSKDPERWQEPLGTLCCPGLSLLAGPCRGSRVTVNFVVPLLCRWGGLLGDP